VRFSWISRLREGGEADFDDFLSKANGANTLALDNSIAGPLGLFTDVSVERIYRYKEL